MRKGKFVRLFMITALFGFTAIHCAQDNPVGSPVPEITQGLQLIQLPQGLQMQKIDLSTTSYISAISGGELAVDYVEEDPSDRKKKKVLSFHVEIVFGKYSVSSDFEATLAVLGGYLMPELALQFGPHGTHFLKPASLSAVARGLDLSWVPDGETLKLYYDKTDID